MPQASTRTRTSPGPGSGTSRSISSRSPPCSAICTALIVAIRRAYPAYGGSRGPRHDPGVPPRVRERLSLAEARRVAVASSGLAAARLTRAADGWALRRVLAHVGLLQMDSVNVLARGHELTLFSRLGPYPAALLDDAAGRAPRRLFEYWGHEASLIPVALQPSLRWRMGRAADEAWGGMRRIAAERPEFLDRLVEEVREFGPVSASELAHLEDRGPKGPWWDWGDGERGLEFLFWSGRVTAARRRRFERLYDLPERVLPREVLETPTAPEADAQRELMRVAARGLGVAGEKDLRDYWRLKPAESRARVAELVESGELLPVAIEGWDAQAYLWHEARVPRRAEARALLGPFDPLLWERSRVERLFGMRYRIEIYVPKPKRVHGYYVLPFLFGEQLVARLDLKADRAAGVLRIPALHLEEGCGADALEALADELELMASWLNLGVDRSALHRVAAAG